MSFGDHLDELRRRLIYSLLVPLPAAIIAFPFSNTLLQLILLPVYGALDARGLPTQMQELSPPEILMARLKISILAAIIVSGPWIIWQIWLFVRPGLYRHEQRFVYLLLPLSLVFSLIGLALMYFIMLPLMLQFMVGISQSFSRQVDDALDDPRVAEVFEQIEDVPQRVREPAEPAAGEAWILWPTRELYVAVESDDPDDVGGIEVINVRGPRTYAVLQQYQIGKTVNFILMLFLAIVVAFQLPLVLLLLGWLDLVSADWLGKQRKYALLGTAVVSAMITPPDILSMILMCVPLYGLYELGILMVRMIPASRVAEGRVLRRPRRLGRWFRSRSVSPPGGRDNTADRDDQPVEPTQPEQVVPRDQEPGASPDDSGENPVDDEPGDR